MILIGAIKTKITLIAFVSLLIGNFSEHYWQLSVNSILNFRGAIIIRPIGMHT